MKIAILFLTFAALFAYIFSLKKRLWFNSYQIRNRDWERQTVFNFLNEIGERLTKRMDLGETLELVVEFSRKATKADAGAIFIKDERDEMLLVPRVVQGLFPPLHEVSSNKLASRRKFLQEFVKKEKLRVGEGVIGLVAESGEAILIPDASVDSRVPQSASDLVPLDGLILAPLVVRGDVQGVLVLINKRDERQPHQTFNEVDRDLVTALADQASVTLDMVRLYEELTEKQRMEQELRVAQDFQMLLLPRVMPDLPEIEIHGFSQPALEVGGDYFDFIEIDDRHLGIVVGDVSGKGIPGALVMATLRSALRAEARANLSPREVFLRVNTIMTRDTKESIFVSATYGILDRHTGFFRFVRAGHEPVLYCEKKNAPLQSMEPEGMVLGMIEDELFGVLEEAEIDLKTAGTTVLYTDGVPEAMNLEREEYGMQRFEDVLRERADERPTEIIQHIMDDIANFTGGIPQHDDITLVVLRWRSQNELPRG